MATVTVENIQAHVTAICDRASSWMLNRVASEPKRYLLDEPGGKILGDLHEYLTKASGPEDFSDIANGELAE